MLLIFFLVTSSMDQDKGVSIQMPPPDDESAEVEFVVSERNVLALEIDEHDRLTCNKETVSPQELVERVEEFVANEQNDPRLPEKSTREVHLMGRCQVSDRHIISVQVDRNTSYQAYMDMQDAIVAGYQKLRNRLAQKRFGHSLAECTQEEHDAIALVYPRRISEQPLTDALAEKGGRP